MLRCQFLCHVLKALFVIKIALKLSDFRQKCKIFAPVPPVAGGFAPMPPKIAPLSCKILAMRLAGQIHLVDVFDELTNHHVCTIRVVLV